MKKIIIFIVISFFLVTKNSLAVSEGEYYAFGIFANACLEWYRDHRGCKCLIIPSQYQKFMNDSGLSSYGYLKDAEIEYDPETCKLIRNVGVIGFSKETRDLIQGHEAMHISQFTKECDVADYTKKMCEALKSKPPDWENFNNYKLARQKEIDKNIVQFEIAAWGKVLCCD